MNLVYDLFCESYILEYGKIYNITIENINEYRKIVSRMREYDYLRIVEGDKIVTNFEIVSSVINMEIDKKRVLTKIIKDLTEISKDEFNYCKTISSNLCIRQYLEEIIFESDYPLTISEEFDFNYLAKSYNLDIIEEYENFIEKIISYIDIYLEILKVNIFVFYNITQILELEEIKDLIEYVNKRNILLINFDIIDTKQKLIENQILFDKDLCRII